MIKDDSLFTLSCRNKPERAAYLVVCFDIIVVVLQRGQFGSLGCLFLNLHTSANA